MAEKNGIGLVGSVIVDIVYEVMEPGNLVYSDGARYLTGDDYESEKIEYGTGGLALNNSTNLAKMGVSYPVRVLGKIGADENGRRIRSILNQNGFSDEYLIETDEHPTSTTHVLHVRDSQGTINRTFRHYFGAMGSFGPDDIEYMVLEDLKIVMIGYCLLLPLFDRVDGMYGALIGQALEKFRNPLAHNEGDYILLRLVIRHATGTLRILREEPGPPVVGAPEIEFPGRSTLERVVLDPELADEPRIITRSSHQGGIGQLPLRFRQLVGRCETDAVDSLVHPGE